MCVIPVVSIQYVTVSLYYSNLKSCSCMISFLYRVGQKWVCSNYFFSLQVLWMMAGNLSIEQRNWIFNLNVKLMSISEKNHQ